MEPDLMPSDPSTPTPLVGEGSLGPEEEFGDFSVGMPYPPLGLADDTEAPSSRRQPPTSVKPATHQPHACFNHPFEQSQHMSTAKIESGGCYADVGWQNCDVKSSLLLQNGYAEEDYTSRAISASIVGTCSLEEEAGFADFSVFREQATHPWCCGFTEQSDGSMGGANHIGSEQISRAFIMESEPRSQHVCKTKDVCIMGKHCENRDAACAQSPQDHRQPQVAPADEKSGTSRDTQGERRCSCTSLQTNEVQTITENLPQTPCMHMCPSDVQTSFCDNLSTESSSADLEQNVSSLASQDDRTDSELTDDDDDEEELGHYLRISSGGASLSLSELKKDSQDGDHYAAQETSSTSSQPQAGTNTEDRRPDLADESLEHHMDREPVPSAYPEVQSPGNLPPSDSFADFCSAPTQEAGEGLWADFEDQSAPLWGRTWSRPRESVSSPQTDGEEKEREMTRTRGDTSLSCRVRQLLESSFPAVMVPAVEGEETLLNLGALLQLQHPVAGEEETPEPSCAQRIQQVMFWPHLDLHNSLGLQFRWAGSHSNSILLRCLGVDADNVVFIGTKKQAITASSCVSSLGMLELTKDSMPAVVDTAISTPRMPQNNLDSPVRSLELPSNQLDGSSRGLSSPQEGTSSRRAPLFWGWK